MSYTEENSRGCHSPPSGELFLLHSILSDNRDQLLAELRCRLEKYLPSEYYDMILFDPSGRRRTEDYYDAFLTALKGNLDFFIKDQEWIGYKRAVEGYPLEGVLSFTLTFKSVIRDFISQYNRGRKQPVSVDDVFDLHRILDHSYYSLSRSYLNTRDEIIDKRRKQLSDLHVFAGEVISVLKEDMLWEPLIKGAENLFGLKAFLILEPGGPDVSPIGTEEALKSFGSPFDDPLAEKVTAEVRAGRRAVAADPDNCLQPFGDGANQKDFRCICHPLPSRASRPRRACLLLHDHGRPFVFERFDQNLLAQLMYFSGAVLVNCGMVSELAEKRAYLSNLTGALFDIQENERKRIAADIHDVLTQALSGIGFKVVLCQELLEKQPERLEEELNRLVDNVNQALRHSRNIVSNLRPNILDDLGLAPALKKMVNDFEEDAGAAVVFRSPSRLDLAPGVDISIFRILQESLHNIRKHARAERVRVEITAGPNNNLEMIIEDDGVGFDPGRRSRGLGLMLMQERAENLGGRLSLKSAPGSGVAVKVVLPINGVKHNATNSNTDC